MLDKTEGQSRIDNPEIQSTLGTRHRTKTDEIQNTKHNTENYKI